ncbi:hypothetical protein [Deinococcus ruber]|uniref:Uncharacterized protein n=1 Tax=Deinococcus ruber TaxID=1848197 RepID=A0A918CJF4_9DEIO|nr:hypothetical protein [Deinococcus ruber]GGR28337.1 hypothetical protein GCM10008957_44480 [Deinococcus ruber]
MRPAALKRIRSERDTVQAVRVGLLLEDEAGNDAFLSAVCAMGDPRRVQRIYARARRLWLALSTSLLEFEG